MANIEIQCVECERIVEYDEWNFNNYGVTCQECGGDFEEVESDNEEYEDIDTDEDEDDCDIEEICADIDKNVPVQSIVKDNIVEQKISVNKFDPEAKTRFD